VSKECCVNNFVVMDPDVNFSDHLPLMVNFSLSHLSDASNERLCNSNALPDDLRDPSLSADNFRKKLKTHLLRNALGHLAH